MTLMTNFIDLNEIDASNICIIFSFSLYVLSTIFLGSSLNFLTILRQQRKKRSYQRELSSELCIQGEPMDMGNVSPDVKRSRNEKCKRVPSPEQPATATTQAPPKPLEMTKDVRAKSKAKRGDFAISDPLRYPQEDIDEMNDTMDRVEEMIREMLDQKNSFSFAASESPSYSSRGSDSMPCSRSCSPARSRPSVMASIEQMCATAGILTQQRLDGKRVLRLIPVNRKAAEEVRAVLMSILGGCNDDLVAIKLDQKGNRCVIYCKFHDRGAQRAAAESFRSARGVQISFGKGHGKFVDIKN